MISLVFKNKRKSFHVLANATIPSWQQFNHPLQTLSGPYLKSSRNRKPSRTTQRVQHILLSISNQTLISKKNSRNLVDLMFCAALHCGVLNQGASNANGGEQEETRLDLRSRGLCLVPLSCTSYVTNENGVWAPPNFRGNWFMPARDTTTGQCIGTNWRLIGVLPAKKEKKMYPLSLCCLSTWRIWFLFGPTHTYNS